MSHRWPISEASKPTTRTMSRLRSGNRRCRWSRQASPSRVTLRRASLEQSLRFRADLGGDARNLDEQLLQICVVLIRRSRLLAGFQLFEQRLEIRAPLDERGLAGITRQREHGVGLEVRDARHRAVDTR